METMKFDYDMKLRHITEETTAFKQEAAKREMDIEIYINELYTKLKVCHAVSYRISAIC